MTKGGHRRERRESKQKVAKETKGAGSFGRGDVAKTAVSLALSGPASRQASTVLVNTPCLNLPTPLFPLLPSVQILFAPFCNSRFLIVIDAFTTRLAPSLYPCRYALPKPPNPLFPLLPSVQILFAPFCEPVPTHFAKARSSQPANIPRPPNGVIAPNHLKLVSAKAYKEPLKTITPASIR
jgi:hypothetical protein